MEEQILTVEEIAKILHIAPNTIHSRRWQERTRCPLVKKGKRRLAAASDFWKWFKEGI